MSVSLCGPPVLVGLAPGEIFLQEVRRHVERAAAVGRAPELSAPAGSNAVLDIDEVLAKPQGFGCIRGR